MTNTLTITSDAGSSTSTSSCACCCRCPIGLASSYTVDYDIFAGVATGGDTAGELLCHKTLVIMPDANPGDPPCSYLIDDADSDTGCGPYGFTFGNLVEMELNVASGDYLGNGVCEWILTINPGTGYGIQTSPDPSSPLGAYSDIGNPATDFFIIKNIVVS